MKLNIHIAALTVIDRGHSVIVSTAALCASFLTFGPHYILESHLERALARLSSYIWVIDITVEVLTQPVFADVRLE